MFGDGTLMRRGKNVTGMQKAFAGPHRKIGKVLCETGEKEKQQVPVIEIRSIGRP